MELDIGVDIGGTFTDLAVYDPASREMRFGKVLTTPHDPSVAVGDGLDSYAVDLTQARAFIHGTTIAINTVIEQTGARTALITTRGFRDVLEIGRGNRPQSYNIYFKRLDPLVPRELRFEITERMNARGQMLVRPQLEELDGIVRELESEQVEAVAICLINSYRNPAHEIEIAEALRERWPHGVICTSQELSREFREYERTSTTVVNAYVAPKVQRYLSGIERRLHEKRFDGPFFVVESNAGIALADVAKRRPCFLMESGPVAGVIGAGRVGQLLDCKNLVAFDMGGTTAKTCMVVDGVPPTTDDYYIGGYGTGYVLQVPVLDMVEVGAGGGSIAWRDDVGAIHVGPRSAGAEPGPVCYGLGGSEPTVTDANLVLGRLNEDYFAGGRIRLNRAAAEQAIHGGLGQAFGMSAVEMAAGIVDLANLAMAEAVRLVTVRRGLDPRDFVMVAYGGGGPLHAAAIARDLSIPTVVIPPTPGNFSAIGMLLMDLRRDYSEMVLRPLEPDTLTAMEELFQHLEETGKRDIQAQEGRAEEFVFQRFADMRYRGQQTTIKVALPSRFAFPDADMDEVRRRFEHAYELRYGQAARKQPAEVVSLRLTAHGIRPRASLEGIRPSLDGDARLRTERMVYFKSAGRLVSCPVLQRGSLSAGARVVGPAVVEEPSSTTLVEPEDFLEVNDYGHLILRVGGNM